MEDVVGVEARILLRHKVLVQGMEVAAGYDMVDSDCQVHRSCSHVLYQYLLVDLVRSSTGRSCDF